MGEGEDSAMGDSPPAVGSSQGGSREPTPVPQPTPTPAAAMQSTERPQLNNPAQTPQPLPHPSERPGYQQHGYPPNSHQYPQYGDPRQPPSSYPPGPSGHPGYQHPYPPNMHQSSWGSGYGSYPGPSYHQYSSYSAASPPPPPPPPHPSGGWYMPSWGTSQPGGYPTQSPGSSRRSSASTTVSSTSLQAAGSTTGRGKRKRVETAPHPVDSPSVQFLRSQYTGIEQQLTQLTQLFHGSQSQRRVDASNESDAFRMLLDSMKETNNLLRASLVDRELKRKRDSDEGDRPLDDAVSSGDEADSEGGEDGRTVGEEGGAKMEVDHDSDLRRRLKLRPPKKRKPAHRSKAANAVAYAVRQIFKDTFIGHILNPEQMHAPDEPAPTPSIDNFVLDLEKPPGSCWNRNCKAVFVDHVLQSNHPDIVLYKPPAAEIQRLFISNFRRQRSQIKWAKMTTQEQDGKEREFRRKERRRTLYYRRMEASDLYDETRRHLAMIAAYGIAGMSTDESDHDNPTGRPTYNIIDKKWRHPAAAGCLHVLDALHRDSKYRAIRKAPPGAQPRNRLHPSNPDISSSRPVRGLPTALYNPAWLERLPPLLRQDLQAELTTEYDFSHEPSIVDRSANNHGQMDVLYGYT